MWHIVAAPLITYGCSAEADSQGLSKLNCLALCFPLRHDWLVLQLRANLGPSVITIGGRLGRALIQLLRLPGHALNLMSFKAQQVMLASTGTKLVAVFVAGIPLCLLGGIIYAWTSGKSIIDGFVNAYGALYKIPGMPCLEFGSQELKMLPNWVPLACHRHLCIACCLGEEIAANR